MEKREIELPAAEGERTGIIVRLDRLGLAEVKTIDDGRVYPFTFDKILSYRGESAGELGLRLGAQVKFLADEGKVSDVEILQSTGSGLVI
jgi:hypothetical protein